MLQDGYGLWSDGWIRHHYNSSHILSGDLATRLRSAQIISIEDGIYVLLTTQTFNYTCIQCSSVLFQCCIISFPSFSNWAIRCSLLPCSGRSHGLLYSQVSHGHVLHGHSRSLNIRMPERYAILPSYLLFQNEKILSARDWFLLLNVIKYFIIFQIYGRRISDSLHPIYYLCENSQEISGWLLS